MRLTYALRAQVAGILMHSRLSDRTALPWHGRAALDVLLVFAMDVFTGARGRVIELWHE